MPGMSGGSGRVLLRRPEGHDPFIDVQPPPPGSSTIAAHRGRSQTLAGPASSLSTPPPQQRQSQTALESKARLAQQPTMKISLEAKAHNILETKINSTSMQQN